MLMSPKSRLYTLVKAWKNKPFQEVRDACGAQLLNAKKFIQSCESLEKEQDLQNKISSFQKLLEEQNQVIKRYQTKYAAP